MTIPPLYYNSDSHSFGFSTARLRWPKILHTAIDDTAREISNTEDIDAKTEGAQILQEITKLIEELQTNSCLRSFSDLSIPGLKSYNETLSRLGEVTWLTGPWLFCECYLYRRLDTIFKTKSKWLHFDVFDRLKRETFKSSALGIYELAIRYKQLNSQIQVKKDNDLDMESLQLLFEEFVDISLWGNATDLSLLANATLDDIKSVQGKEARAKSSKNILCNDLPQAWNRLRSVPLAEKRVDFVLDNAGFELFTDLMLSLLLLDTGIIDKVVLHCKCRPWMVSDTMIKDYYILINDLKDSSIFGEHRIEMDFLVSRIESYRNQGKIELQESEFWTVDLDYWNLSPSETTFGGAELYKYFQNSCLVIFKGDLNYRKLTGDRHWPRDSPFTTAINTLATSKIHILALRTCKADVCAGLPPGKDEELSQYWKSLGNEFGELWCSSGKWAVISYSDGENHSRDPCTSDN
ncbi:hypothetical protein KL921_002810 [Ogataea angusta]|uniref:Sugar phosphate phosphatase n=1 Tax=Pichia angusta TaxID=870730 RepID=A0AAN6DGV3_PICAN|nr:uncharacterized protein KL928_003046 [Ogataea angusta]KAG7810315.1 hypothetical protein KL921_002810 [Ogataea angusta]KAG7818045.1 hypothetical protein KL928_003046 [Ogataea angusta]KAG7824496.1 hypothetical protein KL909_001718 [Ogataea angusta]KAG7828953.1 hypothetical protein KL920_002746 [Ogataea angusta]KAG7842459.1 hypothetical protein KL941_005123 [Ogataea angusta]